MSTKLNVNELTKTYLQTLMKYLNVDDWKSLYPQEMRKILLDNYPNEYYNGRQQGWNVGGYKINRGVEGIYKKTAWVGVDILGDEMADTDESEMIEESETVCDECEFVTKTYDVVDDDSDEDYEPPTKDLSEDDMSD